MNVEVRFSEYMRSIAVLKYGGTRLIHSACREGGPVPACRAWPDLALNRIFSFFPDTQRLVLSFDVVVNVLPSSTSGVDYLPARAPGAPARHLRGPYAYAGVPVRRAKPGVAPSGAAEEGCDRVEHPSSGGAVCQQGAAGGIGSGVRPTAEGVRRKV